MLLFGRCDRFTYLRMCIWLVLSFENYYNCTQALIFSDADSIKENSVKLGAGEDLYALFAGILTMRPWNRVIDQSIDHLVLEGNDTDRSELQVRHLCR